MNSTQKTFSRNVFKGISIEKVKQQTTNLIYKKNNKKALEK
jgi:hypothetical protein